jgi:hypothetical protein
MRAGSRITITFAGHGLPPNRTYTVAADGTIHVVLVARSDSAAHTGLIYALNGKPFDGGGLAGFGLGGNCSSGGQHPTTPGTTTTKPATTTTTAVM